MTFILYYYYRINIVFICHFKGPRVVARGLKIGTLYYSYHSQLLSNFNYSHYKYSSWNIQLGLYVCLRALKMFKCLYNYSLTRYDSNCWTTMHTMFFNKLNVWHTEWQIYFTEDNKRQNQRAVKFIPLKKVRWMGENRDIILFLQRCCFYR